MVYDVSRAKVDRDRIALLERDAADLRDSLRNAILQIEYLHAKFGVTGSGTGTIAQANDAIRRSVRLIDV